MSSPFVDRNTFLRHFGKGGAGLVDPYVSGFLYMYITIPTYVLESIRAEFAALGNSINTQAFLQNCCLALTPPGATLNRTTMNGVGGFKWSVPTNVDIGDTISIKFFESSGIPIYHIHNAWVNCIRSLVLGTTEKLGATQADYKATILYATTKPDGRTLEFFAKFVGVYPTKVPTDSFAGDITASDKLEIDQEYSIDFMFNTPDIRDEIAALVASTYSSTAARITERVQAG
jgi:hypothetical protein